MKNNKVGNKITENMFCTYAPNKDACQVIFQNVTYCEISSKIFLCIINVILQIKMMLVV